MARGTKYIEISSTPELLRLAEDVCSTNEAWVLRKNGEDLAVLMPVKRRRSKRALNEADFAAFRAAAGGWNDVDVDTFLAENAASRRASVRPPVQL
jgi:hypothetical protein